MLRRKPQRLNKIKNLLEQNFAGEANNMQSEGEDTQRSNLDSKDLNITFVLNNMILLYIYFLLC